jgi:hypothetical protein
MTLAFAALAVVRHHIPGISTSVRAAVPVVAEPARH